MFFHSNKLFIYMDACTGPLTLNMVCATIASYPFTGSRMITHTLLSTAVPNKDTFITIGVFDGVHRGHRHVMDTLNNLSDANNCLATCITFRNHPATLLRQGASVDLITSLSQRKALLKDAGLDLIVDVEFTMEMSLLSPRQFLDVLKTELRMKGLVVGPDFAMGHNREGTVDVLRKLSVEMKFELIVIEPLVFLGKPIKSHLIRENLRDGKVKSASEMLGRNFSMVYPVTHGDGLGKKLGFPTANLDIQNNQLIPKNGIYATWTKVDGQFYKSATSIGVRPTFGAGQLQVEIFLLDFEGDLYGKTLMLEFQSYVREEIAFPSQSSLVCQMNKDVDRVRILLSDDGRGK